MKRLAELTVAGVCVTSMAASMFVALGAQAQKSSIQHISKQEVAGALETAGFKTMGGVAAEQMLKVPLNSKMVIGEKSSAIKNPYAGDKQAWEQGKKLYVALNCAVCHGIKGGGGQAGIALNNGHWPFGDKPAEVYLSISHGLPKGMPAWGDALPPQLIWELVTYVKTLPGIELSHPKQAPAALANKARQAPVIRNFGYPASSGQP